MILVVRERAPSLGFRVPPGFVCAADKWEFLPDEGVRHCCEADYPAKLSLTGRLRAKPRLL